MRRRKNPLPLFMLTLALVLAFGLTFTGCGLNQAQGETADASSSDGARELTLDERIAELEAQREAEIEAARQAAELEARRAAELEAERAALARREAEIAEREALLAEQQAREAAEAEAAARQPVVITVPSMTALEIDLNEDLSSETNVVGDPVSATLAQDVIVDGLVALASGSELQGVVTQVVPTRSFGGQAQLQLSFDRLLTIDGEALPIAAVLDVTGERQKKKDAATIGGSAAGGAVLGRILNDGNRDEGTAVGAVVGAAIGAIVAANNKVDPVELPAGTPLVVALDAALTVRPERGF